MLNNNSCHAVILAGGSGSRAGLSIPKQFYKLNGLPLLAYSVKTFIQNNYIDSIVIVTHSDFLKETEAIAAQISHSKSILVTEGGSSRKESSFNGIKALKCSQNSIVSIHDAARPFVDDDIITKSLESAEANGASAVYIKSTDTIALFDDGVLKSIPDRNSCYLAQTPQTFKYHIILEAHENAARTKEYTDDVSLVFDSGFTVSLIEGHPSNFKITSQDDLSRALTCLCKNK